MVHASPGVKGTYMVHYPGMLSRYIILGILSWYIFSWCIILVYYPGILSLCIILAYYPGYNILVYYPGIQYYHGVLSWYIILGILFWYFFLV